MDYGDLDYYVIAPSSGTVLDTTKRFTWLTGRPCKTPKW
jgi:alpha-glucosidase